MDHLSSCPSREILAYAERFDEVHDALYRWDAWAAACLIDGGCAGRRAGHRTHAPGGDFDFDDLEEMHRRLPRRHDSSSRSATDSTNRAARDAAQSRVRTVLSARDYSASGKYTRFPLAANSFDF